MKRNMLLLFAFAFFGLSANAQTPWMTLNSGTTSNLKSIQFLDANNGFAGGGGHNGVFDTSLVIKTTDGGTTWTEINIPDTFPVTCIYFVNIDTGWAVTGDTTSSVTGDSSYYISSGSIWKTVNGGVNWTSVNWPGTPYANLSVEVVDTAVWVGSTFNTGLTGQDIYNTNDGGTIWYGNPSTIDWIWQYGMHFYNNNIGWIAGNGQNNGYINYTTNGGTTWTTQDTTAGYIYGINFQDNLTGYVVGNNATLLKTTNSGTTWTSVPTGLGTDTLDNITIAPIQPYILIVGSGGSTLWSIDGGNSWITGPPTPTTNFLNSATSASVPNGTQFWACGNGGVIITSSIVEGIPTINNPEESISVYPNPASSTITIHSNSQLSSRFNRDFQFILTDISGKEVYSQPINLSSKSTINISFLNDGNYLWEVKSVPIQSGEIVDNGKITIAR